MHAIASFDRWLTQRTTASLPDADRRLRAALGAADTDWLGLLADESQCRGSAFSWRLALWRNGREPQWLSPPMRARAGVSAARLRRLAVGEALCLALGHRLRA
ncbi:MAG: hypothetical protein J0L58_19460 [Burkholderiales bacterium]|nr:hypothetical protein [Burkholderiales bacterium]